MLKIFVIMAAVFVLLWALRRYCSNNELVTLIRIAEILTLIAFVGGVVFWLFSNFEHERARVTSAKITAFEQGRNLLCKDVMVNDKTHSLARGTLVFVGITDENRGSKIELQYCEIHDTKSDV